MLLVTVCSAANLADDSDVHIAKFTVSAPTNGTYTPWRDTKNHVNWYAGEIITITNSAFYYVYFTDVRGHEKKYSGKVSVLKDSIFLDQSGIAEPYRVAGVADGVPVLLKRKAYKQWKETGKISELDILYLDKKAKAKK